MTPEMIERAREAGRKYNVLNAEKKRAASREWHKNNRERGNERSRNNYLANRENRLSRGAAWKEAHREKVCFMARKRARRIADARDKATIQELEAKLKCLLADLTP